ncbi:hypothetical protein EDD11_007410 [Mortierella claussenii]|nr:hypothetical protein EDD11_007410 [Mortierella claussenii]
MPSNPTARSFPGCLRDYKNSPGPVVVRVSYIDRTLRVAADSFSRGTKMVICFEEKDIDLPVGYHFGFSAQAADTGIPDDHDLYSFEVYEVNPGPKTEKNMRPHEEEMIKKGNEVKVDDEDKLMFENIQKAVQQEERKMKEETDGPGRLTGAQFAAKVGDTQYRIIESLNAIHNKLETLGAPIQPPESSSKSLKEIDDKIQAMGISLHAMENVVSGLVEHIIKQSGVKNGPEISKVLKEELGTLKAKMEDIDYRQSYNHHLTQKTLHKSSSWVYYVVFLIVMQAAGLSAWSWYRKRLEMKEKKFI